MSPDALSTAVRATYLVGSTYRDVYTWCVFLQHYQVRVSLSITVVCTYLCFSRCFSRVPNWKSPSQPTVYHGPWCTPRATVGRPTASHGVPRDVVFPWDPASTRGTPKRPVGYRGIPRKMLPCPGGWYLTYPRDKPGLSVAFLSPGVISCGGVVSCGKCCMRVYGI